MFIALGAAFRYSFIFVIYLKHIATRTCDAPLNMRLFIIIIGGENSLATILDGSIVAKDCKAESF